MNKPSEVVTADHFSRVLEASRLLSTSAWREFCAVPHADAKHAARFLIKQGWLTTWQAGQLLGGFHRLVVGNYRLLKEVGRGRWGRVYQAEHRRLGRQVAIRLLAPNLTAQDNLVQRFLAENRLRAALEHRNLIEIYDAASDGDRLYVVMEYVAGTDLRQRVQRQGPLPLHRAADVAYQTAQALDHLHARGVLHGEIQPSSLMSTESGLVKLLLGPGLRILKGDPQQPGSPAGRADASPPDSSASMNAVGGSGRSSADPPGSDVSAQYCAPEQRDGRPVDIRADVFALGRTLCFLVTGRPPSMPAADSPDSPSGMAGPPASLSNLLPEAPQEFASVCAQMMAEMPEDRFPTMRDVMTALRTWRCEGYAPPTAATGATGIPPGNGAGRGDGAGSRQVVAIPEIVPSGDGLDAGRKSRRPRWPIRGPMSHPVAVGVAAALTAALLITALWFWIT